MYEKYEIISVIGEGSFGKVYKCKNIETGQYVAIKKFKHDNDYQLANNSWYRELKTIKKLSHPNIVQYIESFQKDNRGYIVYDYVDRNLYEYLKERSNGLDVKLIKSIMYQLCKAVKYLHKNNIIHRDIKPENILISNNKIKLCDFGYSKELEKESVLTENVTSLWYRAPEILLDGSGYGKEIDFWSIGCVMGELIDGNPVFPGNDSTEQLYIISKTLGKSLFKNSRNYSLIDSKFDSNVLINPINKSEINVELNLDQRYGNKINKDALDFIKRLLDPIPKTRLNSDSILSHSYFCNLYEHANEEIKGLSEIEEKFLKNKFSSKLNISEFNFKLSKNILQTPVKIRLDLLKNNIAKSPNICDSSRRMEEKQKSLEYLKYSLNKSYNRKSIIDFKELNAKILSDKKFKIPNKFLNCMYDGNVNNNKNKYKPKEIILPHIN